MGPKKVKKTAKQKEEEKLAAEAEKKLQEELEAARLAEEEAKRKAEEERRAAEEKKRREEELVRLNEQAPLVSDRETNMRDKRANAIKSREQILDDKFLACDPLPDPENEKDLTTFITLWKESKDKDFKQAVQQSQTAEDVNKAIQLQLFEALSQYDHEKVKWCQHYIRDMREIMIEKYDQVCAHAYQHIDKFWSYTEEELKEMEKTMNRNKRVDLDRKPELTLKESTPDVMYGFWVNIVGRSKSMAWIDFDMWKTTIPRQNSSQQLILRCIWTSFDYVSSQEDLKKSDTIIVGGMLNCRMFLFQQPHKERTRWTMRKIQSIEDTLKEIPYPEPSSQNQADPVSVQYRLPETVFTSENDEIQVGVWDSAERVWSTDFIEDLQYNRKDRWLQFSTRKFAPIAYLQPKTTDFPFDSWYIRSTGNEVALLTLVAKRIKLEIEIHPLYVKLIEMPQNELKHLNDKQMHIGMLLQELHKCGIHLLPEDDDAARAGIPLKDQGAEERAIMDIAQTLKVFSFQSLKWNVQSPEDSVICRLRENPDHFREFYEDGEDDWESVQWWKDKCVFIDCKNSHEKFNGEIKKGQATQAMLALAVKSIVEQKKETGTMLTQDAVEACEFVFDIDFIDNVQRTMRLLRLMSFTTGAFDKRTLDELNQ